MQRNEVLHSNSADQCNAFVGLHTCDSVKDTVRRALRVASETIPEHPASSADDAAPTTPQDRERAPALG
jgi:hypothetical protein